MLLQVSKIESQMALEVVARRCDLRSARLAMNASSILASSQMNAWLLVSRAPQHGHVESSSCFLLTRLYFTGLILVLCLANHTFFHSGLALHTRLNVSQSTAETSFSEMPNCMHHRFRIGSSCRAGRQNNLLPIHDFQHFEITIRHFSIFVSLLHL